MENNRVSLIGHICGDIRVLKRDEFSDNKEIQKVELIVIPNDIYDKQGVPNSQRCHAYGTTARMLYAHVRSGDRVSLEGHLRRVDIRDKETGKIRYDREIVIKGFSVLAHAVPKTPELDN